MLEKFDVPNGCTAFPSGDGDWMNSIAMLMILGIFGAPSESSTKEQEEQPE